MGATLKALFHALARSAWLKRVATTYGMRSPGGFARRFIAGDTLEEAIEVARRLESQGRLLTLDYLGESVTSIDGAAAVTREYVRLLHEIVAAGIERNISLKLTQLGAAVDRATCVDNLRRILEPAGTQGFFVRIDMESSEWTDLTLEVFETMWQQEYRNIGIALQAALHRTDGDVTRMNELGAPVRLVKGAYKEPASVAHQRKDDVDAAFVRLMQRLLDFGTHPAIATHDPAMVDATKDYAGQQDIAKERFEFEMLYGIRRDLQASLVTRDYRMRVYVPFGREWFPYFMRRLGERPANLAFVIRSMLSERQLGPG